MGQRMSDALPDGFIEAGAAHENGQADERAPTWGEATEAAKARGAAWGLKALDPGIVYRTYAAPAFQDAKPDGIFPQFAIPDTDPKQIWANALSDTATFDEASAKRVDRPLMAAGHLAEQLAAERAGHKKERGCYEGYFRWYKRELQVSKARICALEHIVSGLEQNERDHRAGAEAAQAALWDARRAFHGENVAAYWRGAWQMAAFIVATVSVGWLLGLVRFRTDLP